MENAFIAFMLLLVVLYTLLLILRQRKARQEALQARRDITVGSRVMMTSGICGTVLRVGAETIDLEIAPGVITEWHRDAVREPAPIQTPQHAEAGHPEIEHTEKERDSQ